MNKKRPLSRPQLINALEYLLIQARKRSTVIITNDKELAEILKSLGVEAYHVNRDDIFETTKEVSGWKIQE